MEEADYRTTFELEDHNWWFVGMRAVCRELIDPTWPAGIHSMGPLLDVGCGTGFWLREMADAGGDPGLSVGLEPSSTALEFARERSVPGLVQGRAERLPFADGSFGLVTAIDVLEHVEADGEALTEWARVLRPGGRALILTSAYQWLWSGHDVSNQHFRRYRRREVDALVGRAGLVVERSTYVNSLLLPPIAAARVAERLARRGREPSPRKDTAEAPRIVDRALLATLVAERRWLRHADLPAGVSIVVTARKPG